MTIDYITRFLLILAGLFSLKLWQDIRSKDRLYSELIGQIEESEYLEEKVLRLRTEYLSSDYLLTELKKQFTKLETEKAEQVKLLANLKIKIEGYKVSANKIRINRLEDSPEICEITSDNQLRLYSFSINQTLGLLKNREDGRERMVGQVYYILDEKEKSEWAGKPYLLDITEGILRTDPTESNLADSKRVIFWPFNLNLGVNSYPAVSVNTVLIGYGKNKKDLDMKLLSLGLQINKNEKVRPVASLVYFRLLPSLLTNSYLGVDYLWDNKFSLGFNVGL